MKKALSNSNLLIGLDFTNKNKKSLLIGMKISQAHNGRLPTNSAKKLYGSSKTGSLGSDEESGDHDTSDSEHLTSEGSDAEEAMGTEQEIEAYRVTHQIQVWGSDVPAPVRTIRDLKALFKDFYPRIKKNLAQMGIHTLTPVQKQTISALSSKRDVIVSAPTGCGKTAAFLLPAFAHLLETPIEGSPLRAIILVPTLELAIQIQSVTARLTKGLKLTSHCASSELIAKLMKDKAYFPSLKCDLFISTPGTLLRLLNQGAVSIPDLEFLLVDEADRLFDKEFMEQFDQILAFSTPKLIMNSPDATNGLESHNNSNRKKLIAGSDLFMAARHTNSRGIPVKRAFLSATIPPDMEDSLRSFLYEPIAILIGVRDVAVASVSQELCYVGREDGKFLAIKQLIHDGKLTPPCIIFTQEKARAYHLYKQLFALYAPGRNVGINAAANTHDGPDLLIDLIHSDRSEKERRDAISRFREGKTWVLICTDLLARGLDITGVKLIINYDLPTDVTSYIHRVGRSGRAGATGTAISYFTDQDKELLPRIARVVFKSGGKAPEWLRPAAEAPIADKRIEKIHRAGINVAPSILAKDSLGFKRLMLKREKQQREDRLAKRKASASNDKGTSAKKPLALQSHNTKKSSI